jgi:hypothetical protein
MMTPQQYQCALCDNMLTLFLCKGGASTKAGKSLVTNAGVSASQMSSNLLLNLLLNFMDSNFNSRGSVEDI